MLSGIVNAFCEFAGSVRRTFASHLPLYVCAVLFTSLGFSISAAYHVPLTFNAALSFLTSALYFFWVGIFLAAVAQCVRLARAGSERPLRDFGVWFYRGAFANDRLGNIFHTLATITPLMLSFTALKGIVPLIQPFSWDKTFMEWDRVLAFGHMPWELLQPILGHPPITAAFSVVYALWFFVMFGTLIWQAFFASSTMLRMQFLVAFAFSWFIAGNLLAVAFSSAGPCYYGYFQTPDPYGPQMAYLRDAGMKWPVWSVVAQDWLWKSYLSHHGANIGISAMPSMHVVSSALMAIIGFRTNKWLGLGLTAFCGVIILGSVHLGWHYAVDSIAGVGLAFLFWNSAGMILHWHARQGGLNGAVPAASAGSS